MKGKESRPMRRVNELADFLRGQGIGVVRVLKQTTERTGQPDVVTHVGLELENHLDIFVSRDGTMRLSWWMPDENELVPIGEYAPTQVDKLVKAIRQATR
jgi:hypothetical protein